MMLQITLGRYTVSFLEIRSSNVKTVDYKVVFPLFENCLHAWIKSVRDGRAIQAKAISFMNEDDRSFTALRV
jgi:hypothetical protein